MASNSHHELRDELEGVVEDMEREADYHGTSPGGKALSAFASKLNKVLKNHGE